MSPSDFAAVRRYPLNGPGRDFVIGDIHGCFSLLKGLLEQVGFDRSSDRLFAVGDLVDRGPESHQVLAWLAEPWFHAVRGNHEQLLLDATREQDMAAFQIWMQHGGTWWFDLTETEQGRVVEALAATPYAIEIETEHGPVGIVHADVPGEVPWQDFLRGLEGETDNIRDFALWSRRRLTRRDTSHVAGLWRAYCGHTVLDEMRRMGNVVYLDTGACFGLDSGERPLSMIELPGEQLWQLHAIGPEESEAVA